jgi:hypothetical protein
MPKIRTTGGNPAARGLRNGGLGNSAPITGSPGKFQALTCDRPPAPWRSIGLVVDKIVERLARRQP